MRSILVILMVVLLIGCSQNEIPAFTDSPIYSYSSVEGMNQLTFEAILKESSRVVSGQIVEEIYQDNGSSMFKFLVEDCIDQVLTDKHIYVTQRQNYLVSETNYVIFLTLKSLTGFPYDFYVYNNEFIFHKGEDGSLLRLKNPMEQTFIKPFVDDTYNNYSAFTDLIHQVRRVPPREELAQDSADFETRLQMAEYIIEVTPTSLRKVNPLAMEMFFSIKSIIKGGDQVPRGSIYVPLNSVVNTGETYVLLLTTASPNFLVLVTRNDSIISQFSPEFEKVRGMKGELD